jgi:hypothetical protein
MTSCLKGFEGGKTVTVSFEADELKK